MFQDLNTIQTAILVAKQSVALFADKPQSTLGNIHSLLTQALESVESLKKQIELLTANGE